MSSMVDAVSSVVTAVVVSSASYRPHQQRFIDNEVRFWESPGRIIDHELGSGKTLTVIGAIEALRRFPEFQNAPVLVLTMKALIDGFKNELRKSAAIVPTRADLYTVTTAQRFYLKPEEYIQSFRGGILVVDEAHNLRNPKSKRYRVVFQAAKQVRKTYLMSGTITINYSVDVAPLFNLILSDPTRVKHQVAHVEHCKRVVSAQRAGLPPPVYVAGYLPVTRHDWDKKVMTEGDGDSSILSLYMRCLISHHVEDHESPDYKRHFPKVKRYAVKVSMTDAHYKAYKKLASDEQPNKKRPNLFKRQLDADMGFTAHDIRDFQQRIRRGPQLADTKNVKFLAWMQYLRMACNSITGEEDGVEYMPKIAHAALHIVDHFKRIPHYKATVTTTFIAKGIRLVQRILTQHRIPFVTITGRREDVSDEHDIQRHVQQYNSGQVRVMLFSAAGQHGLDLHGTHDAFILNPHWNVGLHRQAEARVIRFDSHKDSPVNVVNVYYYTVIFPPERSAGDKAFLPLTADEYLKELGIQKEEENKRLTSLLHNYHMEASNVSYLQQNMRGFHKRGQNLPKVEKTATATATAIFPSFSSSPQNKAAHVHKADEDSGDGDVKRRKIMKRKVF